MSWEASTPEINACYEAYANSFLPKSVDFVSFIKQLDLVCQYWLELNQQAVELT